MTKKMPDHSCALLAMAASFFAVMAGANAHAGACRVENLSTGQTVLMVRDFSVADGSVKLEARTEDGQYALCVDYLQSREGERGDEPELSVALVESGKVFLKLQAGSNGRYVRASGSAFAPSGQEFSVFCYALASDKSDLVSITNR